MPFFSSFPDDANVATIFATRPEYYGPWVGMTQTLMRGESPLSAAQRELIAAWVSRVNQCDYCHGGHAVAASILGYPDGITDQLREDIETAAVEEAMKPILRYVRKLALEPHRMVQADADAVFDAGWDERALQDAIAICCVFSFMNRLTLGHGIAAIPELFEARGRRHVDQGYDDQYVKITDASNV
ncbi:MAG: peroxidase-related enzyme [Alphaproteobacteria bacterium]|nr:peroxidase-related enzyme [Alphaproteobacteria bacterium]